MSTSLLKPWIFVAVLLVILAPSFTSYKSDHKPAIIPQFELNWNPENGQGQVVQNFPAGDLLRVCFHCAYRGYSGGLIIGSYNSSGFGFSPARPIHGFKKINVFCAQDESIWDLDEKREYSYGWSENFGTGSDGERLNYIRGRILDKGPVQIVLQSENSGGCYRVIKVAYSRLNARWWILATRIINNCSHDIKFDFYSGDDPWLGTYRSSDGDVGWTPAGIIRTETLFGIGQFTEGGLYDLGNQALGQKEGSFSNQANFFKLDPATILPDQAIFANSFAHSVKDIDPNRVLDNRTMTALNLGWTGQQLKPGKGLTLAWAMGLAETDFPGQTPRTPLITDEDWSVWRKYLKEGNPASSAPAVEFAAERVEIEIQKGLMQVRGSYYLRNRHQSATTIGIGYPVLTSPECSPPSFLLINGHKIPVKIKSDKLVIGYFPRQLPPSSLTEFQVGYSQNLSGRQAAYMVTSAHTWPTPITRTVFVIRYLRSLGDVSISYPVKEIRTVGDWMEKLLVFQPFQPDRELVIKW